MADATLPWLHRKCDYPEGKHPPRCQKLQRPSTCAGKMPQLAFVVAGMERGFISQGAFMLYHKNVISGFGKNGVGGFGKPASGEPPRVFLHLHLAAGSNESARFRARLRWAVEKLQPAALSIEVDAEQQQQQQPTPAIGSRPTKTLHAEFAHPECHWHSSRAAPVAHLTVARWWRTMSDAWRMVTRWEKTHAQRFDSVIFSRPDIFFEGSGLGPWCSYDLTRQWYAPYNYYAPDMLFFMPRSVARKVLTTLDEVLLPCTPPQSCCNLTQRYRSGRRRVPVSFWLQHYWQLTLGLKINTTMLGWGLVSAHAKRNCTLLVGCQDEWYDGVLDLRRRFPLLRSYRDRPGYR